MPLTENEKKHRAAINRVLDLRHEYEYEMHPARKAQIHVDLLDAAIECNVAEQAVKQDQQETGNERTT